MFLTVRGKKYHLQLWFGPKLYLHDAQPPVLGIVRSYWPSRHGTGEKHGSSSGTHQLRFANSNSRGIVNSDSKAKEPIARFPNTWMLLHAEHFFAPSVCSQRCLSCCWGYQACPLRCSPVKTSLPATDFIRPQFTGFNLCCQKLSKFQFRSDENAAWNHLVSFWLYIRAPDIWEKNMLHR